MPDKMEVVAFRYDGEKYCPDCFRNPDNGISPIGKSIRFTPVQRAIQELSEIKNCSHCGKDLLSIMKQKEQRS